MIVGSANDGGGGGEGNGGRGWDDFFEVGDGHGHAEEVALEGVAAEVGEEVALRV